MKRKAFPLSVLLPSLLSSLILAACGGGGGGGTASPAGSTGASSSSSSASSASSASTRLPTLVECFTLKIGVSYEAQSGKESEWLAGTQYKNTHEYIRHSFEGLDTIGDRSGSRVGEYRLVNGEFQSMGRVYYLNEDLSGGITNKLVYSPFVSAPDMKLGETKVISRAYVRTSYDTNGNVTSTKAYASSDKIEFLGYEDVTLGDGTVLKNACKNKWTTLSSEEDPSWVGEYGIGWSYPGYGGVKGESYTPAGVKASHSLITKVIQAP